MERTTLILIAVMVVGLGVGFIASETYSSYPYYVSVAGHITTQNASDVPTILALPACDISIYTTCPDLGQLPTGNCNAPTVMQMGPRCTIVDLIPLGRGSYRVTLRNGEDYNATFYLTDISGNYAAVCRAVIALEPAVHASHTTIDLSCT